MCFRSSCGLDARAALVLHFDFSSNLKAMDGLCHKCHKDLRRATEKYVDVSHKGISRAFHPACHACSVCESTLRAGHKYTVIPATGLSVCEACWIKQHGGKANEMPTASGGVSWTPKSPELKGFVWQQVSLLDISETPEARKAKIEATEKPMGTCDVCNKKIYEQAVVLGANVKRHVECHRCYGCRTSLESASFFEHKNRIYCEPCVTKQVATLSLLETETEASKIASVPTQKSHGNCAVCHEPLLLKVISAGGKVYHPETCFKCAKCSRKIAGGEPFYHDDEGVLCEKCGE